MVNGPVISPAEELPGSDVRRPEAMFPFSLYDFAVNKKWVGGYTR